jgi:hypothetical protein
MSSQREVQANSSYSYRHAKGRRTDEGTFGTFDFERVDMVVDGEQRSAVDE